MPLNRRLNITLWILQGLLAVVFLLAGVMKFVMPADEMMKQSPLPLSFLRFIGVAEVAGALGLVLPGLLRIRPVLTPLAAAGLTILMIGATVTTISTVGVGPALFPLIVGVLSAMVAHARWRLDSR